MTDRVEVPNTSPSPEPDGERRRPDHRIFASLANPNYKKYFFGQATSLIGTWMQRTAQSWLVLTLTHSGTALGVIVALQTIPVLVLGPYGGVVADRVDRRRLMLVLQTLMGVQALLLGLLTVTHQIRLWQIGVLAVALGLNNCFENPARQSYVQQMVGPAHVRNAVTLNSVLANAARAIGPALAGILIATVGVGVCFLLNAASFVAVVGSLLAMDTSTIHPGRPVTRARGQLREGLRYVAGRPDLLVPLLMMGLVGCLAYEFQVVLPIVAHDVFHGGAQAYGFLTSAMGVGAVVGGLFVAGRGRTGLRPLTFAALGFGIALVLVLSSPGLGVAMVAMLLVGCLSITFMSTGNASLQLTADPSMRGRVMSLWQVAFQGTTPIGGPVVGWVAGAFGGRAGLGVGAAACLAAAGLGAFTVHRRRTSRTAPTGDALPATG